MKRFLAWAWALMLVAPVVNAYGYLTPLGKGVAIEKYHVHGEGGVTLWIAGGADESRFLR